MSFTLKTSVAVVAALLAGGAFAANTGGFATTDGGNVAGALVKSAATMDQMNAEIAAAKAAKLPLILTYTGNEDALIAQVIKDHTIDANHNCPNPRWNDAYRKVEVKDFTYGLTIQGANGSSANFGIPIINSSNVIVRNMKIGALAGANNDADMIRVDNSPNVWIDHNELFSVNNECNGSPDGDLTFESAIDIKKNSTHTTVSYNYIHDSKKVGLDGHTQSSGTTDFQRNVTYHHNIYNNVNARLPLQRGGIVHAYNNLYSKITDSGINVRAGGKALIERNYFENSISPVTCRYDTVGCGTWYLDSNNTTSAASNATYGITWTSAGSGGINADTWVSTLTTKPSLTYTYEPVPAQCVKDKLASYAGVGKNGAVLTASACSGSTSSAAASSAAASSAATSSAASSSKASSSAAASSAAASSAAASSAAASSSASTAPVLSGTGDYPSGYSKCADLGGTCTAGSTGWVAFGRKGSWVSKYVGSGKTIACTVAAFGSDPLGNPNKCSTK
ncbi:pectate lyase [Uliginosibacterium sp. TH139]|uniref:pectate lyase family protein n=1 Tax=Uliginosibacterium sp. TH139 TaxID=2067453 RepID=UPI000C7A7ADB|nr:pectate lyase [Uliginosibacterium sp. TH139]PLK50323.1 pectate lyase [Uliginosibacterium sp. TH139]